MSCTSVSYKGVVYESYEDFKKGFSLYSNIESKAPVIQSDSFQAEAKEYIKSIFPKLSETELNSKLQLLNQADLLVKTNGVEAYGLFKDGVIYLDKNIEDKSLKTQVIKHEIFHMIFNQVLTSKEKTQLFNSAVRENKTLNPLDEIGIEEYLADKFMSYKSKNNYKTSEPLITKIFNKVLEFFDFILGNHSDIAKIFDKINAGDFSQRAFKNEVSVERFMRINEEYDGVPKNYRLLHDQVIDRIKSLTNPRGSITYTEQRDKDNKVVVNLNTFRNVPLSRSEAINFIKEEFKDRVFELSTKIELTDLEKSELGLKSLLTQNNGKPFDNLIKDIYPTLNWKMKNGIQELELESGEYTDEDIQDINNTPVGDFTDNTNVDTFLGKGDVTVEAETINPLKRASESVKDMISTVTYTKANGEVKRVDPGFVFYKLIKSLSGIKLQINPQEDSSQAKERILKTIKANLLGKGSNKVSPDIKSIYDDLEDLFDKAYADSFTHNGRNVGLSTDKSFTWVGTNQNSGYYKFNYKSVRTGNIVSFDLKNFKDLTPQMFKAIHDSLHNVGIPITYEEIRTLYEKAEAENTLAEIFTVTGSLREKKVYLGKQIAINFKKDTELSSSSNFKRAYHNYGNESFSDEYKSRLQNLIVENIKKEDIPSIIQRLDSPTIAKNSKGKNKSFLNGKNALEEKRQLINYFFKDVLLYGEDINVFSDAEANDLLISMDIILKNLAESSDFKSSLKNLSKSTRTIVAFMIKNKNLERSTSFTTSDGKTKWFYTLSNSAQNFLSEITEGDDTIVSENLKSAESVFVYNFLNPFSPLKDEFPLKTQKLYEIVDHESTLDTLNQEVRPTGYNKENAKDFTVRNLFYQFFATIATDSTQDNLKYFQSFYTISDKPQMSNGKVNVLNDNEIKLGLQNLIMSEAHVKSKFVNSPQSYSNFRGNRNSSNIQYLDRFIESRKDLRDLEFNKAMNVVANNKNILEDASNYIFSQMEFNAVELLDSVLDNKITFDENSVNGIKKVLKALKVKSDFDIKTLPTSLTKYNNMTSEDRAAIMLALMPAIRNFVGNYYVNSYMLNQLTSGDSSQYKNYIDNIKRMAGPFAIGQVGFIKDPKNYHYNAVVLEDIKESIILEDEKYKDLPDSIKTIVQNALIRSKGGPEETYESADGSGYAIPQRMQFLRNSFGRSANLGTVIKPVYFGKNEQGIATYVKNSLVEITNELARAFPKLSVLRFEMTFGNLIGTIPLEEQIELVNLYEQDIQGYFNTEAGKKDYTNKTKYDNYLQRADEAGFVHEALFVSAVKTGKPQKLTSVTDLSGDLRNRGFRIDPDSKITLNNQEYRIQLNLRKTEIESKVSNPTQINYFVNSNNINNVEQQRILQRLSEMISFGLDQTFRKFGIEKVAGKYKVSDLNQEAKDKIKQELYKLTKGVVGSETIAELLFEKDIDINFPVITDKIGQVLLQKFAKETTQIKHPGKKLILQSVFGTELSPETQSNKIYSAVKNDQSHSEPELIIKRETVNGKEVVKYFAEAYVPKYLYDKYNIQDGDFLSLNHPLYNELVGYRIPSTELHSAIPLKVIGYYPSAENDNVIIVPKEIVLLHGSDFDIDTLYTLNAALASKTIYNPETSEIVAIEGIPIGKTVNYTVENGKLVLEQSNGLANIQDFTKDGKDFLTYVKSEIDRLQSRDSISLKNKAYLEDLIVLYKKGISNDILYTYTNMISSEKNVQFMMKPITQEPFDSVETTGPESTLAYAIAKLNAENPVFTEAERKNFSDYLEEYAKGNVDTSLREKILKGKKYLSNFTHQQTIYLDNFLAKDLTGISANFMKGIRYLFIGSNEANPLINDELKIEINGKTFSSLNRNQFDREGKEIPGSFNTDIIDTIINAAIDHVKEQKLNMFNITTKNAAAYMASIAMGINMTDASFMQIQPSIMEMTLENRETSTPTKLIKYISDVLIANRKGLDEKKNQDYLDEIKSRGITSDSLVENYTSKGLKDLIKENNIAALEYQLAFLQQYKNLYAIGDTIDNFSKVIGIIQQYGKDITDTQTIIAEFNKILDINEFQNTGKIIPNGDFIFTNFNVGNSSNIKEALIAALSINDLYSKLFHKYNPQLSGFAENIENIVKNNIEKSEEGPEDLTEDTTAEPQNEISTEYGLLNKNKYKSIKASVEALIQYITGNLRYEDPITGETRDLSTLEEDTIDYGGRDISGFDVFEKKLFYLGYPTNLTTKDGRAVRVKSLFDILEANTKTNAEDKNKFLNAISIKYNFQNRTEFIAFMKGAVADALEKLELKEDFNKLRYSDIIYEDTNGNPVGFMDLDLPKYSEENKELYFNDFQHSLLKYAVQKNGLKFSSQSYVSFINSKLYSIMAKNLSSVVETHIENPDLLENLKSHFLLNYILNYGDKLPNITTVLNRINAETDPEYTKKYANQFRQEFSELKLDEVNNVYYNIKIPVSNKKDLKSLKPFINIDGAIFIDVTPKELTGAVVYYQKITNIDDKNISYQYNRSGEKYNLEDHFNARIFAVPYKSSTSKIGDPNIELTFKSYYQGFGLLKEGMEINLYNANDLTRTGMRKYTIKEISDVKDLNDKMLKLEYSDSKDNNPVISLNITKDSECG